MPKSIILKEALDQAYKRGCNDTVKAALKMELETWHGVVALSQVKHELRKLRKKKG